MRCKLCRHKWTCPWVCVPSSPLLHVCSPWWGCTLKGSRKEEKMKNGTTSTRSGTYPALHSKSGSTHLFSEKNIFDPFRSAPPSLPVSFPVSPSHPEPHFFFFLLPFTSLLCPFHSIPAILTCSPHRSSFAAPCAIKLTHNCTIDN